MLIRQVHPNFFLSVYPDSDTVDPYGNFDTILALPWGVGVLVDLSWPFAYRVYKCAITSGRNGVFPF